jgi:hypothetical protein
MFIDSTRSAFRGSIHKLFCHDADQYENDTGHFLACRGQGKPNLVEAQLKLGISVIVDSVFMGSDRSQALEIAKKHNAAFRPIHTFVSDEKIWEQRVRQRVLDFPEDEPATWERIQIQRRDFLPWKPNSALFVDAIRPCGRKS